MLADTLVKDTNFFLSKSIKSLKILHSHTGLYGEASSIIQNLVKSIKNVRIISLLEAFPHEADDSELHARY